MFRWGACNFIGAARERGSSREVRVLVSGGGFAKGRRTIGLTDRLRSARVGELPPMESGNFPRRYVAIVPRGDGVVVLFENSTVCFVCDSAKFFVWLRPFHIPVVGVAFFEQPVCLVCFLLGLCFL